MKNTLRAAKSTPRPLHCSLKKKKKNLKCSNITGKADQQYKSIKHIPELERNRPQMLCSPERITGERGSLRFKQAGEFSRAISYGAYNGMPTKELVSRAFGAMTSGHSPARSVACGCLCWAATGHLAWSSLAFPWSCMVEFPAFLIRAAPVL